VEVVDYARFVEMREFCHVVCLVEFARIDFVDALWRLFSYTPVIALYPQCAIRELLYNFALDKCLLGVSEPHVFLSRHIILSFYTAYSLFRTVDSFCLDELWRKRASGRIVSQ
jgi:hypothetical protein